MNIALYPGTFNPITYGHIDIIERGAKLFDKVFVCVAESSHKKPLFTINERIELVKSCIQLDNVEIIGFKSLLVNLCHDLDANIIIRGLRMVSDFEYEFQLAAMNRQLDHKIETIFLTPSEQKSFISSTIVREIARLGGNLEKMVPESVANTLHDKFQK